MVQTVQISQLCALFSALIRDKLCISAEDIYLCLNYTTSAICILFTCKRLVEIEFLQYKHEIIK